MATRKNHPVPAEALAAARQRAEQTRRQLEDRPGPAELLTPQELADAAPFYFVLRDYIRQLKEVRESAGLTLAEVSARSGLAVESLSRLETGALTNPTWKTLGVYAAAVGRRPRLSAETIVSENGKGPDSREITLSDKGKGLDSGTAAIGLRPTRVPAESSTPERAPGATFRSHIATSIPAEFAYRG